MSDTVGQRGGMSGHEDANLCLLMSFDRRVTYRTSTESDNDSSSNEDEWSTNSDYTSERVSLIRKTQPSDISPQRISATLLNLLKLDDYTTNNITQDLQYIFDCVDAVSDMNTEFGRACLKALEAHLPELFHIIYPQCFYAFSVSPTFDKSATMTNMQLIGNALWTGTDKSEVMCQKVLMVGLAADFFTYLDDVRFHSPSQLPMFVVKKCIRPLLSILYNIVKMCREASSVYRKAGAIDTLLRFCALKNVSERCVVNFLLAHIIPENENKKFNTNNENIAFVVQMLRDVCEKPMARSYGFSVQKLLSGINKLAVNDANKKCLVKNNILHLYTRLMRSDSPTEQRLAAEGVWELSFTNRDDIAEEKGCLAALHDLASGEPLRQVALMALHNVEGGGRQLTVSMGRVALHNLIKEKKVFISYEKSTEMLVLEIGAKLESAGFYVCKNENNSPNEPSLFAQLYANDVSPCGVLIAASRKYQDSLKCRQEATYAVTLACRQKSAVNIVPIIAEEGYTPDGWLHYVFMNFPCTIDFTLSTKFESNISELVVALSRKDISGYIRTHVKHRTCCRFISDDTATGDMCFCGRELDKHGDHVAVAVDLPDVNDGSAVPWDFERHTAQIEASCFGTVKFTGFGSEVTQEAPYARVDHRTEMGIVWTMLRKYWNMPPPKLIISVIGGERDFHMSRQLRSSFKRGLVRAATSAGAWVVSGGSHGGVSGLVGEAFREYVPSTFDHEPVALGIAGWGVVDNNLSLMSHDGNGLFPATYNVSPAWDRPLGKVPLDHNHTHFLLVDNGTERQFDTELRFRLELERYLAVSLTSSHDDHVPVVLLVLEGGLDSLRRVAEAVETGTLVVVIAGSGRAADLIASAHSKAKSTSELVTVDEEFFGQIRRAFNWPMSTATTVTAAGELSKSVAYLNRILEHKSLVTVYTPHDYSEPIDIDYVILEALAEGTKFNPVSQLQLALDWNRSDIAAKHIFNIANSGNREDIKLEQMMFTALMQNQVDFVKLFIDSGFDLTKFLTVNRLNQLYLAMLHDGSAAKVDLFRHLLERVQSFITKLRRPRPDTYSLTNVGKAINFLLEVEAGSVYDENSRAKFARPERELMYWALLFDRQELAIFLWSYCPDPLGAALTAGALLTSLAKQSNNDEKMHMSNDLRTHAREFEELAVGVLNECHISDTQLSHRLLVRRLHMWSDKTPLTIARGAHQMSFMEHVCVQTKLNRLWMGNMSVNTSVWKIIFLLLPFIKFSSSELGDDRARRVKWHASSNDPDSTDGLTGRLAQTAVYFVSAPVIKFYFHTVSFVMFMALFSYVVMTNLRPTSEEGSPAISEYVLWGCSVTLVVEEVRQAYSTTSNYLRSSWNRFDLVAYSTLILSVILRYTVPDSHFSVARMTYCVALVVFYLRFLQVFFIDKNIGPKVIMVRRMVTDVMFFVCILLVFMVSYGTVSQALRYPNSPLSWSLLNNVIYYPFWFIHGQFDREEMEGNVGECSRGQEVSSASHGLPRCPETSWLLMPISGAYLVIANILLLNLLIAMFSNTFKNVQDQSETLWRYYLYDLIYEYFDKPALPPPLIIFSHLHRVWKFAAKRLCHTYKRKDGPEACGNAFCRNFSTSVNDELTKFERHATEKYLLKKRQLCNEHIDMKVQSTRERIDKMAADLEDIKERVKSPFNLPTVQCRPLVKHYEQSVRHIGLQCSMHNAI